MQSKQGSYGFRVTERYFSNDERLMSIGIANIHAIVPDVEANKAKIVQAMEIFKERRANIAIFPEFCLSGYFWEDEKECRKYMEILRNPAVATRRRFQRMKGFCSSGLPPA